MSWHNIKRFSSVDCAYAVMLTAALGTAAVAHADTPRTSSTTPRDHGDEVIVVEGQHGDAVVGHGFRTVVDVDEHRGETTSLAEVLASSVGINVRSLGGLGGFASVSIRGASPSHTAVFVDGIPLSRLAFVTQDLGALDLSSFSTLEVYRGAVPAALGGAALGGAINLRTKLGPDDNGHIARVSIGGGSFGARHLHARLSDEVSGKNVRYHVGVGYRGATGDYEYFNDNGTSLLLDDDEYLTRTNNGFDQLSGVGRMRYEWRRGSLELGSRTIAKQQGVPGVGSVQADSSSLRSFTQLADARVEFAPRQARLHARTSAFVLVERQRYQDLAGEVGLGTQDNRYHTFSIGMDSHVRQAIGARHVVAMGGGGRMEQHRIQDMLDGSMDGPRGVRWSVNALVSDDMVLPRGVSVVPALRIDHQRTDPGHGWDPITAGPEDVTPRSETFFSPRITARMRLGRAVLKASAGRYFRAPTLTELFGDRGFVVGNPALKPEVGISSDLGFVFAPKKSWGVVDKRYVQAAVFASRPRDAIVMMPSAGRAALAQNVGNATIVGFETAVAFRMWRALSITGNYTYIDSRQDSSQASYDGKRLPLRPRHELYARSDVTTRVGAREIAMWADVTFTSGNFLDAANLSEVPRRLLLGAGVKVRLGSHLLVGLDVKNLTDKRVESITLSPAPRPDLATIPRAVSDFLGYPLPGRAFYLTADTSF